MKKMIMLLLAFILCSCSISNNSDSVFLEEYGLADLPSSVTELSYDELYNNEEFDGTVIFVRNDCKYCHEMLDIFQEVVNENYSTDKIKEIFLLDTSKLEVEDKESLIETYSLTSVPTLAIFEKGHLKLKEIGIIPKDRMKELIIEP